VQAALGVGVRRVHAADLDDPGGEQSLDVAHRGDEALALALVERRQERGRQLVAAPVEHVALSAALAREVRGADPPVAAAGRDGDQPGGLERAQQAADVARVELEVGSQRSHVAAVRADLPQHARLAEGAVGREEAVVERAEALRDDAVEATNLLHHAAVHCLTLVRGCAGAQWSAHVSTSAFSALRGVDPSSRGAVRAVMAMELCRGFVWPVRNHESGLPARRPSVCWGLNWLGV
jgi:hypothetical protein